MSYVGKPMPRVDARDKVMGRAKYAADLCDRNVLTAKILHAEHAHALVKSINVERARAMEGVEAVFTCFDVPKNYFPTAGHPWSRSPSTRTWRTGCCSRTTPVSGETTLLL